MIQFQDNIWTDGRTLSHRTLPATTRDPITFLETTSYMYKQQFAHTLSFILLCTFFSLTRHGDLMQVSFLAVFLSRKTTKFLSNFFNSVVGRRIV